MPMPASIQGMLPLPRGVSERRRSPSIATVMRIGLQERLSILRGCTDGGPGI